VCLPWTTHDTLAYAMLMGVPETSGNAPAVQSRNGTDDPPSGGWGTLVSPADDFFRSARQSPPRADLRSLFFNLTRNAPH
jgi:hypothetical protein